MLDAARLGGLDPETDFFYRLVRRVRFERMLHQLEQEFDVAGERNGSRNNALALPVECQMHRLSGQRLRL